MIHLFFLTSQCVFPAPGGIKTHIVKPQHWDITETILFNQDSQPGFFGKCRMEEILVMVLQYHPLFYWRGNWGMERKSGCFLKLFLNSLVKWSPSLFYMSHCSPVHSLYSSHCKLCKPPDRPCPQPQAHLPCTCGSSAPQNLCLYCSPSYLQLVHPAQLKPPWHSTGFCQQTLPPARTAFRLS